MFSHEVHDFCLLTNYEVQLGRSIVSYAEHNTRRFQKIIDELIQFPARLSGVITMQEHDHRERLGVSPIGVADDESNQFAESLFSSLIAGGRTSFERNGLERSRQFVNGLIAVFRRRQIELGVTVVAPMSNSYAVVGLEMIKCAPKQ